MMGSAQAHPEGIMRLLAGASVGGRSQMGKLHLGCAAMGTPQPCERTQHRWRDQILRDRARTLSLEAYSVGKVIAQRRLRNSSTIRPALRKYSFSRLWAASACLMWAQCWAMKSVAAAASSSVRNGFGTRVQPSSTVHCRAARSLLDWTQSDLVNYSGSLKKTGADFERGLTKLHRRTLAAIITAFEPA
jgi:hypothetical protein